MAAATSDLNLLYGMLALQLDFVTKDQLLAGMQAWILDKSKRLSQILLDQGVLSADRQQLLNALVKKHIEAHGNDPQKSIAALNVYKSAREAFQPIRDPDVHASLGRLREPRPAPRVEQFNTVAPAAGKAAASRFRILRPHAKGGLGVVFVARDEEIGREVALKEIQIHLARDADSRARFELEAEITGGLEHPSIVPVYGLGHYADGRPYYAMRFIRGDSLKEATDRFHKADVPGRDPTERSLALRQLLRHFTDVCNAIEYAHSKGVLHRDLKPGNIMLGRFGETLVVDWGLAKAQGKSESHASTLDRNEAPLTPSSTHNSSQTQMGSAIGTPAFMSPEQAAGRLDLLGAASDIYSLGATLYYVLTGKPSIVARDLAEVLRCVKQGDFAPPRAVNPRVDKALDAICLKAMAREAADRYISALDLKTDIDRWLDDSPVLAWREPWTVRARRWLNRHRTTAIATVAGILVAALILGVATALLTKANEDLAAAKKEADDNAIKAREQEKIAIANAETAAANEATAKKSEARAVKSEHQTKETLKIVKRQNYANTMTLAQTAWLDDNVPDAFRYLGKSDSDVRGWEYRYLDAAWKKFHRTLSGHTRAVRSVAISPDGQRIVSGGEERTLRIWNAATGREVFPFKKGHAGKINSVVFTPDGKRIISAGDEGTVKVWDASNGDEIFALKGHKGGVSSVAVSADGQRIVSGGRDKTLKVWDARTGEEMFTLTGHRTPISSVAMSPDGERIASCNENSKEENKEDSWVKVWDVKRTETFALKGHDGLVWCVAFSADGRHIVSGGDDAKVRVWDAATGALLRSLKGHKKAVWSVAFSADGERIVSGGEDKTLQVWSATTGEHLRTLRGHTSWVTSVAFSKDGASIVSGSADYSVKIWDANRSSYFTALDGHADQVNAVALSDDGWFVVTGSDDGTAKVWDAATGRIVHTLTANAKGQGITCVALSKDGKRIVTGGRDKMLKVWDAATGKLIFGRLGHKNEVTSVALTADGQFILSGSRDKTVIVWDAMNVQRIHSFEGHNNEIYGLAVSPDGKRVASSSVDDKTVIVWDAKSGAKIFTLAGHTDFVTSVAFSADGRRLVSGATDKLIKVWDAATGKNLLTLEGHSDDVWSVAFSSDGERIVSGGADATVRVWDATVGLETLVLRDHKGFVRSVAVSRDGRRIVSGGDRTALLREAP